MEEKYGFVYIWFDRKHHRFYVGSHWGYENDGYICSSDWMRHAYRKRPKDFKRKIINKIFSNRRDLFIEEQRWLNMIKDDELNVRYYNLKKIAGSHWSLNQDTRTIKQKISDANKGKSSCWKGQTLSEEHRKKISEAKIDKPSPRKGAILTDETKEKIRQAHLGKSAWWNKGKIFSEEHRKKLRESNLGKHTKTHCKRGHLLDEENSMTNGKGSRTCRICSYERSRKRRLKREG
jgi:hypothetical protein